jgi:hypothetical protein
MEGRLGAVLEHGDHVASERPDLLVGLAQLGKVLAARRSAEMSHESDNQRPNPPSILQLDSPVGGLEDNARESIILGKLAHAAIVAGCRRRRGRSKGGRTCRLKD